MGSWSLKGRSLEIGDHTRVMGIVNVTPDSFSDGGRYLAPDVARDRAAALVDAGADLVDVGGESTRPGSSPVSPEDEIARVVPAVEAIAAAVDVPISVDTRNAAVAERALAAGAHAVNDVSALTHDADMTRVVAESGAGVVLMHMRGTPATMQAAPRYDDVVSEVEAFFRERISHCRGASINASSIALDPGIGFGKRLEDNLALLAAGDRFLALGHPLVVGASRKSMFGHLLDVDVEERLVPTAAATAVSAFLGASIVRVHDVKECAWAAKVGDALRRARGVAEPAEAS